MPWVLSGRDICSVFFYWQSSICQGDSEPLCSSAESPEGNSLGEGLPLFAPCLPLSCSSAFWLLLSRADSIKVADPFPRVSKDSWLQSVMRGVEAAAARAAVWHPACDGLTRTSCPVSRVNQVKQSTFVPVCRCLGLQRAVDVFGSPL